VEPEIRGSRIEAAQALLEHVKSKMPEPLKVEKVLREGEAATEIVAAAQLYGADLIIMGTHGRGPVGQVFVGSVANAVTRKAHCPVMTVAHPLPACKGA
jgi:nucleotide-binding universal stress UspA family protein